MKLQSTKAKLAEIEYRSKITLQHLGKKRLFVNELDKKEFRQVLNSRLNEYQKTFSKLKKEGIKLSPFLEIGAEYGLASSFLVSRFKAKGIAMDISPYSLANTSHFAKTFHFSKLPTTICADANNLPFAKNSFPFVFVYESLHHFPDPLPVIKEIYRVLAPGGVCLIGADPIKQTFQIKLWRRPTKLRAFEKYLKLMLLLPFISHIGKTEVDHGIFEEAFTLTTWQKSLSIFDQVEVLIETPLGISDSVIKSTRKDWLLPKPKVRLILFFLGGGLSAICTKNTVKKVQDDPDFLKTLICPDCLKTKHEERTLLPNSINLVCPNCQRIYTNVSGVLTLFEKHLNEKIVNNDKLNF